MSRECICNCYNRASEICSRSCLVTSSEVATNPYNCLILGNELVVKVLELLEIKALLFSQVSRSMRKMQWFPQKCIFEHYFNNKTLIGETSDLKWHPKFNSTYCNSKICHILLLLPTVH